MDMARHAQTVQGTAPLSTADPLMVRAASEAMLAIANVIVAGDYGNPLIRDQLLVQLTALGEVVLAANGGGI